MGWREAFKVLQAIQAKIEQETLKGMRLRCLQQNFRPRLVEAKDMVGSGCFGWGDSPGSINITREPILLHHACRGTYAL
jgi:hypothetical protein